MARPEAPLGLLTHLAKLYRCMGYDRYAAPDVEYHVLRHYDRDRGINFLHPGGLRFFTLSFPGRDFLFIVLIATIFLPAAVTIIPTYTFFQKIGWLGTWLPLIVPAFFANAYDVFLLRQYFMTLPRELDEAAMIDGASPLRVLWSVILPQSYPALMAVTVFHIVFAWNDYFGPLIYLSTARDKWPISVALANFNGIYGQQPQLIQAGALMALIAPLILFMVAQRFFVQGIVVTGVEK